MVNFLGRAKALQVTLRQFGCEKDSFTDVFLYSRYENVFKKTSHFLDRHSLGWLSRKLKKT